MIYYSQDARMYTPVVVLALLSLIAAGNARAPPGACCHCVSFIAVNWLMTGYHYYSLLLIGVEGLFFVLVAIRQRVAWRTAGTVAGRNDRLVAGDRGVDGLVARLSRNAGAGFRGRGHRQGPRAPAAFFDELWRDLTFGSIRWQSPYAVTGYLLLPLIAIGGASLLVTTTTARRPAAVELAAHPDRAATVARQRRPLPHTGGTLHPIYCTGPHDARRRRHPVARPPPLVAGPRSAWPSWAW